MRRMIPQKLIDAVKKLAPLADKIEYSNGKVKVNGDFEADGITSKGIANTGALANIGDVAVNGDGSFSGTLSAKNVVEEGDTELIDLSSYINSSFAKSHTIYAKLLVKHGLLTIVLNGKFVAGTSAGGNPAIIDNFMDAIPEAIKSKIVRQDGTNLTEAPSTGDFINRCITLQNMSLLISGAIRGGCVGSLYSISASSISIGGFSMGSIAEDTECSLSLRITLTL